MNPGSCISLGLLSAVRTVSWGQFTRFPTSGLAPRLDLSLYIRIKRRRDNRPISIIHANMLPPIQRLYCHGYFPMRCLVYRSLYSDIPLNVGTKDIALDDGAGRFVIQRASDTWN